MRAFDVALHHNVAGGSVRGGTLNGHAVVRDVGEAKPKSVGLKLVVAFAELTFASLRDDPRKQLPVRTDRGDGESKLMMAGKQVLAAGERFSVFGATLAAH